MPVECALPFKVDGTGGVAFVNTPSETAHQHVLSVLGTDKGERVMRGDYGTDTLAHAFNNVTQAEMNSLRKEIAEALAVQVPDVVILGIDAAVQDSTQINLTVRYRLSNDTTSTVSLTVPVNAPSGSFSYQGGSL